LKAMTSMLFCPGAWYKQPVFFPYQHLIITFIYQISLLHMPVFFAIA